MTLSFRLNQARLALFKAIFQTGIFSQSCRYSVSESSPYLNWNMLTHVEVELTFLVR